MPATLLRAARSTVILEQLLRRQCALCTHALSSNAQQISILYADEKGMPPPKHNLAEEIRKAFMQMRQLAAPVESKRNERKEDDKDDEGKENDKRELSLLMAMNFVLAALWLSRQWSSRVEINVSEDAFFETYIPSGEVAEIVIQKPFAVTFTCHPGAVINGRPLKPTKPDQPIVGNVSLLGSLNDPAFVFERFELKLTDHENALQIPRKDRLNVRYRDDTPVYSAFAIFNLVCFTYILIRALRGRMGKMFSPSGMLGSMRKARYTLVEPGKQSRSQQVRFSDVAGLHEAKIEIAEFVDYLKKPDAFTALGAKLPKGAILLGPPGCGKTLLAKAVATESNVPFMAMSGADFVEVIGGLGAARVRDLFADAKKRAPCIIYIDEIDAVGRKRAQSSGGAGGPQFSNREGEQTLNQLLVEMDGVESGKGIVVMASTNRADILDSALLRPGRFDRHIQIDLPTLKERQEVFELYLKRIKLDVPPTKYSNRLAHQTPGFSGADIGNIVNEAAIHAASHKCDKVTIDDLNYALDRVISGSQKRSGTLSPEEKMTVAYHECGHALIGWMLPTTDALLKVTIIPRTAAALGFAQYSPADRRLFSKEQLTERICMALGGRAAENVVFGRVTTGAEDDLRKVTKIAYDQVKVYGMSDTLGPLSFPPAPGDDDRTTALRRKPFSRAQQTLIDKESMKIISDAYSHAERLLREHRDKLDTLARALHDRETLTYEDVQALIGRPPHGQKSLIEMTDPAVMFPQPMEVDESELLGN